MAAAASSTLPYTSGVHSRSVARPSAAMGSAVSRARSSGDDLSTVTSRPAKEAGGRLGHHAAGLGQVEAGNAAVQHALRILNLTMPDEVNGGTGALRRPGVSSGQ
jgi:hypothetical protein